MKIKELVHRLNTYLPGGARLGGTGDADAIDVVFDSRDAGPGVLFTCFRGVHTDGHLYAEDAVRRGASAVLCERELSLPCPSIIVSDARYAMGCAASEIFGRPTDSMMMIGLTGTNGKTTTAYLVRAAMRAAGIKTGMTGTVVYDDGEDEYDAEHTTPEGSDIQRLLARMRKNSVKCCVSETSSHGLEQGRLRGCEFDVAAFSNLTHEHLEFHHDMERYYKAKKRLFTEYMRGGEGYEPQMIINVGDEYGARLADELKMLGHHVETWSSADYTILRRSIEATEIEMQFSGGMTRTVSLPLIGDHNAANAMMAALCARAAGADIDDALRGIGQCGQIPGRLERFTLPNGASAFVDFAHSPDGIEKIMSALRPLTDGRLIIVWGAGGDRTKTKRPIVGELMASLADLAIITSDNPRSEDPASIASDVEEGAKRVAGGCYEMILDRREAIIRALSELKHGDVAVIAGKGPERGIQYADHLEPFTDKEAIESWVLSHA